MKRRSLLVTVSVIALVAAAGGIYVAPLMADPVGDKDCGTVLPDIATARPTAVPEQAAPASALTWVQHRGTVNDASCLSRTPVAGVIAIRREGDVAAALAYARTRGLTVSAAGLRHSMGGAASR